MSDKLSFPVSQGKERKARHISTHTVNVDASDSFKLLFILEVNLVILHF